MYELRQTQARQINAAAGDCSRQGHGSKSKPVEEQGLKLREFDISEYLDNDEVIAEFLTAALEHTDPEIFISAVGHVAKARGMTGIAESTGLGRESLYKAFAPGAKPRYETVIKVLQSLGLKLRVVA